MPISILQVAVVVLMAASVHTSDFQRIAARHKVNPVILEGICRYESNHGQFKVHHNRNGTWDVGYCQNHRYDRGDNPPPIPGDRASIQEAARELKYWRKQHQKFCVDLYQSTGQCGKRRRRKWRGMKNCHRPHPWWGHYNWGFRVLKNNYDKKVQCFIDNGFKRCKEKKWRKVSF